MAQYQSPTGSPISATLERIIGLAMLAGIDPVTGEPEYTGDTKVIWDEQKTVERNGKMVFVDDDGEEWTFDQLVRVEDPDEPEADLNAWPEDGRFTFDDWARDVAEGNTRLGYADWVRSCREQNGVD